MEINFEDELNPDKLFINLSSNSESLFVEPKTKGKKVKEVQNKFDHFFELGLIDVEQDTLGIPEVEYDVDFTMKSENFAELISELMVFGSNLNMGDLPNPEHLHDHITGMLEGKLGKLAKEIAEETAENLDLGIDVDGSTDMKDVFNKIVKNPGKLMNLVKNVGEKLDTRIKSGEIKESELIAEATEIMNKMKNMPGMDGIQEMLSKMGMSASGLGKGGKVNYGAMEAELNKKMRLAKMKERMHAKSEMNKAAKEAQTQQQQQQSTSKPAMSEEDLIALFSKGEKAEKTPRNANPNSANSGVSIGNESQASKPKNKKKKGKK
jgi:hypothetical protein